MAVPSLCQHPLPWVTCSDHSRVGVCTQHALVIELALMVHVVLKLSQGLRWLQQLPVLVVRKVVLNEQSRMGEEVELIVPRMEDRAGQLPQGTWASSPSPSSAGCVCVWGGE